MPGVFLDYPAPVIRNTSSPVIPLRHRSDMRDDTDRFFEAACIITLLTGFGLIVYSLL